MFWDFCVRQRQVNYLDVAQQTTQAILIYILFVNNFVKLLLRTYIFKLKSWCVYICMQTVIDIGLSLSWQGDSLCSCPCFQCEAFLFKWMSIQSLANINYLGPWCKFMFLIIYFLTKKTVCTFAVRAINSKDEDLSPLGI